MEQSFGSDDKRKHEYNTYSDTYPLYLDRFSGYKEKRQKRIRIEKGEQVLTAKRGEWATPTKADLFCGEPKAGALFVVG